MIIDMSELQEAVSRNVRVLMALRGVRSQSALARAVGVEYTNFNAKVRGKTAWTLEDIEKLADEFKVPAPSLLGEVREFLDPNLKATGKSQLNNELLALLAGELGSVVIPFPQVEPRAYQLIRNASVTSIADYTTRRSSRAVAS